MEKAANGPVNETKDTILQRKHCLSSSFSQIHAIMTEEDLKVEGLFECNVSYKSHSRAWLCTVCVCGRSPPWTHSALLTEDSELLLNDKSAKKESMRLQLHKHFQQLKFGQQWLNQSFASWGEFPPGETWDRGYWINGCEAPLSDLTLIFWQPPAWGCPIVIMQCGMNLVSRGRFLLQRKLIGSPCIWSPSGIASAEINSLRCITA